MTAEQWKDPETVADHRRRLLELLPPGSRVRCVLRHVSASGMTRWIDLYAVADGELVYLTGYAETVLEGWYKRGRAHDGLKIEGAGMDMGFALVYALSSRLYPDGFDCIGDGRERDVDGEWSGRYSGPRCPANDHFNGDRDYTPGHRHAGAGGYAVGSEWI